MKVKYANFDLVMYVHINAMKNLRKMGRNDLADVVGYIVEELQKSQNELLDDAVPAKEYDLLVRRLEHLLESDYIRSFDEKEIMTGRYKRDIREAGTAPVLHAKWLNRSRGYANCSNCDWEHPEHDDNGYDVADDYCPNCGAKMAKGGLI